MPYNVRGLVGAQSLFTLLLYLSFYQYSFILLIFIYLFIFNYLFIHFYLNIFVTLLDFLFFYCLLFFITHSSRSTHLNYAPSQ